MITVLVLLARYQRPPVEALSPNGISLVYQPGATASQTPRQASIPTPAELPPPPAPPPPPTAPAEPEVNLNIPQNLLAQEAQPQPRQSAPPAAPGPPRRQAARPRPAQKYTVMNNMSFGNSAAPPVPFNQRDLNLSLPQSDAEAANAPEISVQGNVGKDWEAGFNKWVYAHLYYPDAAAEQGQQGTVTVEFTAHRDGSVTGLHMTGSSGSPFLDQGWTGIFAQNQLPPFPPGGSDTLRITATVHYEIDR